MFEGLKKKFSEAIRGFVKKEEKEIEQKAEEAVPEDGPAKEEEPKIERKVERKQESPTPPEEIPKVEVEEKPQETVAEEPRKATPIVNVAEKKEESLIKLSLKTKIKKVFLGSVVLSDQEIDSLLSTLKISMLESDVTFDVAESFIEDLGTRLRGKKIESREINRQVTENVREALLHTLNKGAPTFELMQLIKSRTKTEPFVILFLGPNGTGKTTTIAKITNRLKRHGITTVLAASDTFRAAAIEQIDHHAKRLGVPLIKSSYGADPASIAFDAIAYGKAHRIDTVLIDSAGRQETNASLIKEVEKMVRVAKPDMTIFVGESTAGNAIANQIVEFSKHIKIHGIVLTKLDCDAKGGSALSISHLTGIPILFFGVGEGYEALMDYDPLRIVDAIMPNN